MITILQGISKRLLPILLTAILLAGCTASGSSEDPAVLAEALSSRYGLEILIGEIAAKAEPWDYHLVPETDPEILSAALKLLDENLQNYPAGMLQVLSEDRGGLKILLVREILGKEGTGGLQSAKGLQFEDPEGCSCLALAKDREYTLYHELCHVIEDFVLLRTPLWDDWEKLNPPDFFYDLDFQKNARRDPHEYLDPQDRSFIDTYSMSFPREDRARIMEYAMTSGHRDFFFSPVMQAKLRCLSQGIREAFGLQNSKQILLWEQYLKP